MSSPLCDGRAPTHETGGQQAGGDLLPLSFRGTRCGLTGVMGHGKVQLMELHQLLTNRLKRWCTGFSGFLLAGLLALPGPCIVCKLQQLPADLRASIEFTSRRSEVQHATSREHPQLAALCREHHEHRLTAQPTPTTLAQHHFALPLQSPHSIGLASASKVRIAALTFTGPSPPVLDYCSPRAPPLAFPRV